MGLGPGGGAAGGGGWACAHLRCPRLPEGSRADWSRHPNPHLCGQPAGLGAGQDCTPGLWCALSVSGGGRPQSWQGGLGGPSLWTLRSTRSVALTSDRPSSDPAIVQLNLWALLFLSVKWERSHSPCGFAVIVPGNSLPGKEPSLSRWPRALLGQSPQPQPW